METQKIKKQDLAEIYKNVCESWQKRIAEKVMFSSKDEIEIPQEWVEKGYNEADARRKALIKKYFKVENSLEDIKSFDNILKLSGKTVEDVLLFRNPKNKSEVRHNALAKILLIAEVLNQGWEADWNNKNQHKYYPYFDNGPSGWVFCLCCYRYAASDAAVAYFKSSEIAELVGKTFLNTYVEFITGEVQK